MAELSGVPGLTALALEADAGLLDPLSSGTTAVVQSSDASYLLHLLQVEAAWTAVLADHGMVTEAQAAAAAEAADPRHLADYDLIGLAHAGQNGGNVLIPALQAMRARAAQAAPAVPGVSAAIHVGATSQDIMDTAMLRMAAQVAGTILADLRAAVGSLAELATEHRATPMVARSLAQHSLPSTFGLRAAGWMSGLAQAGRRLEDATADLPIQWGGAAGTMAALAGRVAKARAAGTLDARTDAFTLVEDLAVRLGLQAPAGPWQTNRMPITGLAAALADVVAACGKIANDVLISARIENGELGEPLVAGRGGSSAMPHKQNPVLSVMIHAGALGAPGTLAQVLTAAGAANEERPDGAWHAEWPALRQLLRTAGGAAARTAELVSGLRVNTDRMVENLNRVGPLLVSERLMAELAPLLEEGGPDSGSGKGGSNTGSGNGGQTGSGAADSGTTRSGKERLQEIVDRSLDSQRSRQPGNDFRSLLRAALPDSVSDAELDGLLDPANYTGEATTLVDRLVAEYRNFAEWSTT
ncbi:lyase family protein [Citricoccus sp. NPDC079358]|uniref:lyase family protein n=1 Tax=Citricoccus sp. NPDC079358 TaxID=3154653 RepID=UPI00344D9C74